MSRSITYTWPASNETDVCKQQTLAAAGNLVLNGNLANQTNSAVDFTDYGYARSVTITSTANLSARTFTINGTQNGVNISENRTGPNATTVESLNAFDTITSVSVNGAVANVTIGSGYFGFFKLLGINLERDVINYVLSTHKLTANSISTTIFGTLSNVVNNGKTFKDITANDFSLFEIKAAGILDQYIFPDNGILNNPLYKFIFIAVEDAAANSIQLNFIQT